MVKKMGYCATARFIELVDALLEAFRADTGLTRDQIIKAMKDLNAKPELRKIFQELFEQVLAMDEFPIFLHLMINRNLELQKQALMLITMMHGGLPSSLQEGGDSPAAGPVPSQQEEDEVLKAVLEQSKREYEAQVERSKKEEEDLKSVIVISQVESMRLDEQSKKEQEKLTLVMRSSLQAGDGPSKGPASPSLASMPPLPKLAVEKPAPAKTPSVPAAAVYQSKSKPEANTPPSPVAAVAAPTPKPAPMVAKHNLGPIQGVDKNRSSKDAAADWLSAAQQEVKSSDAHSQAVYAAAASMAGMSEADYKKRVEFLKQQRDKLMEMKRKEREKQLLSAASTQPNRPSSARAARAALNQPGKTADSAPAVNAEEEKKLAMRKAIASRIKSEVMGKK
nr:hypothetical protein BaRGS_007384 [Batillaria attramentaria]